MLFFQAYEAFLVFTFFFVLGGEALNDLLRNNIGLVGYT